MHTNHRERKSAPPLKQPDFSRIKAREMPDFSKRIAFRPIKDSRELTIPLGFELASLKRHAKAVDQLNTRLAQEASDQQSARYFKSKAMPDYEAQEMCIMPSDKPSTVAWKPNFASDSLKKKEAKVVDTPMRRSSSSPKEFIF